MSVDETLTTLTAREVVTKLRSGDVSPLELVEAALARYEEVDGSVNALPTICAERARDHALHLMNSGAMFDDVLKNHAGWLGGLPIAVKDLLDVKGVRTTYGSPIFKKNISEFSDLVVEKLEESGAIVLGKSNTPEFGAGANTFNEVFGKSRNPWNTELTCGGSSGGSAVALATGQVWLATGSDLGGSLRIPASFCSVVGLRPSPGRVARGPVSMPFDYLSVEGPMARNVGDVALMLDAMSGWHAFDPISLPDSSSSFLMDLENPEIPSRVAFSRDLNFLPVDREVADVCEVACRKLESCGAIVEETCPNLTDATKIFQTLRAALFASRFASLLEERRDLLKPEIIWNIEKGLKLTADEIGQAERARATMYEEVSRFFEKFDLLICPAVTVPPFDVEIRYITEVADHKFDNYVDWLGFTYTITLTTCPAISVPVGFNKDGLPIGLQMVGRPKGDGELLKFASLLEGEINMGDVVTLPIDPR